MASNRSDESSETRRAFLRHLEAMGAVTLIGCSSSQRQETNRAISPTWNEATKERSSEARRESTAGAHPRPLFRRYPALAGALPWLDLGGLPTPLTEVNGDPLGLSRLLIKHDEHAGNLYGGSKARKLEQLLAEARSSGKDRVLTFGGVGSNHALATAVHARSVGLGCALLLLPERRSDHAAWHLLAEHHLGCEQYPARGVDDEAVRRAFPNLNEGERPFIIPAGGTSALGNVGYVNAAFELAEQLGEGGIDPPEVIYVAAGTTGTSAGLYVGLRALGLSTRLVAVRTASRGTTSLARLSEEIEGTSRLLHELEPRFPEVSLDRELLRLEQRFAGGGYAIPSRSGREAAVRMQELYGLELDGTYTAKTFAALMSQANSGRIEESALFWNTYDPRPVDFGEVTARDLPPAFRGYVLIQAP